MTPVMDSRCSLVVIGLSLLSTGCPSSDSRYPVGLDPDTSGGGGVQRATLAISILSEVIDSSIVRALGLQTGGALPDVEVTIRRVGSSTEQSATSDPSGSVQFTQLLPGDYAVSAIRLITSAEQSALDAADQDVSAFGGALTVGVTAPTTSTTMRAAAGRRGSLVISELFNVQPQQPSGNFYNDGMFLELYNNTDTAITLSGKIVAKGFPGATDAPNFPCSLYEAIWSDTAGIWAMLLYRFPPNASPVLPGQAVVLATDAIDHTQIATGTYDLSSADFEFSGSSDVDNPSVPDLMSLGPRNGSVIGHGLLWYELREVVVLADTLTFSSLVTGTTPTGNPIVRIPAAKVLDVLTAAVDFTTTYPPCRMPVADRFDHQEIVAIKPIDTRSLQRRVLSVVNGRELLLRTKTSSRDFRAFAPSPGRIQ